MKFHLFRSGLENLLFFVSAFIQAKNPFYSLEKYSFTFFLPLSSFSLLIDKSSPDWKVKMYNFGLKIDGQSVNV